jgi:ribosome modulation factor
MTHLYYVERQGMRGYLEGVRLRDNPYDRAISVEAHDAWMDGWLDASRARGRYVQSVLSARQQKNQAVASRNSAPQ